MPIETKHPLIYSINNVSTGEQQSGGFFSLLSQDFSILLTCQ